MKYWRKKQKQKQKQKRNGVFGKRSWRKEGNDSVSKGYGSSPFWEMGAFCLLLQWFTLRIWSTCCFFLIFVKYFAWYIYTYYICVFYLFILINIKLTQKLVLLNHQHDLGSHLLKGLRWKFWFFSNLFSFFLLKFLVWLFWQDYIFTFLKEFFYLDIFLLLCPLLPFCP